MPPPRGTLPAHAANAVRLFLSLLPPELRRARLRRERLRAPERLALRYELDLVGFLNGADAAELAALCAAFALAAGKPGAMRQRLWALGARLERRALVAAGAADADVDARVQPPALLQGGRLRVAAARTSARAPRGALPAARAARFPPSPAWPRPVPPPPREAPAEPPSEPTSLDELLARADALVGVRLGARGRDKGAYGQRLAALLGVARSSAAAPDWRGEVEIKTVAVVRARGGAWRLKDGPALSMRGVDAREKLARVLWLVRADEGEVPGAPLICWFYQELDVALARAFERARHLRPKGGAGTRARGWYLRRDFFNECGLMNALNGPG